MEKEERQPQPVSARRLPIIPECEVFYEGGQGASNMFSGCKKNPGHPTFIPVNEFNTEHLPPEHKTKEFLEYIRDRCDATVKIVVKYTSPNRPDVYPNSDRPYPYSFVKGSDRVARVGTGMLTGFTIEGKECPCEECLLSGEGNRRRYRMPVVITASHVIFDELEAEHAVFEFFYDSEEDQKDKTTSIKRIFGMKNGFISSFRYLGHDVCMVKCFTHDEGLLIKLKELESRMVYLNQTAIPESPWAYMISHPHGMPKKITVGTILHFNSIHEHFKPSDAHCYVINDVKFRLPPKNPGSLINSKSNEYFVPGVNSDQFVTMTYGNEYSLQSGMKITLTPDAEFYFRYRNVDENWISFPKGTQFSTTTCGREIIFPPETEFYRVEGGGLRRFHSTYTRYVTYDLDTCPGCSGATVVEHSIGRALPWIIHSGALEDGVNVSGYCFPAA